MFLTDNQIANIYKEIICGLQNQRNQQNNQLEQFKITQEIVEALQHEFNEKLNQNLFGALNEAEKNEAFKIFYICLSASPGWNELPQQTQIQLESPIIVIHTHHRAHRHHHHSNAVNWMLLGATLNAGHHHHHG